MKRPRLFLRWTASLTTGAYYVGLLTAFMTTMGVVDPSPAQARVDPLLIISRQIHKPNMLIVLDTSGSLTGVPGGSFSLTFNRTTGQTTSPTEVGVDCDDGNNCRGGDASGVCAISGKVCSSDIDCRSATCKLDGSSCLLSTDCAPVPGKCTQLTCDSNNANCVNAACVVAPDSPASTSGTCATSKAACNPKTKCTSSLKCTYGTSTCSSTSTPCASYALCQDAAGKPTAQQCAVASDCPTAVTGGTCAVGAKTCSL